MPSIGVGVGPNALRRRAASPPPVIAPTNTVAPSISGSAQVGQTIIGAYGTWTESPTFARQWLRDGTPIAGANTLSYLLQQADLGAQITLRITATNAGGSAVAVSNSLGPVVAAPVAPAVTTPATISGTTAPTGLLTVTVGAASGTPAPTSAIQWRKDGANIAATGTTVDKAVFGAGVYAAVVTWSNGTEPNAVSTSNAITVAVPSTTRDTFTSAGSTDITAYVGESGQAWTRRSSTSGATTGVPATATGGQLVTVENTISLSTSRGPVLGPNQFAEATFVRGTAVGSAVAIAVRMSDTGHSYWFRFNGLDNAWQLFRTTASENAALMGTFNGSIAGWTAAGNTALARIEANGSTIRALVNGVQIISVTDTNLTTGRAGIRPFRAATAAAGQMLTDFDAGDLPSEVAPTSMTFTPATVDESAEAGTTVGTFA